MTQHCFSIGTEPDGSYWFESTDVYLRAEVRSPELEGENVGPLHFMGEYSGALSLGGIQGVARADVAERNGLRVWREILLSDDRRTVAVRVRVKNERGKPVALKRLVPIAIADAEFLRVAGGGLADWRITRLGRQKSDIPGSFSFVEKDENYTDATFDASKLVAGMGVDNDGGAKLYRTDGVAAEPCFYIKNMKRESAPGLLFGVVGQEKHLTTFLVAPEAGGGRLGQMRAICEFDGVVVDPGEERDTHWILITEVVEERDAFADFTEIFAKEYGVERPSKRALTVYCAWQFYAFKFLPEDLDEMLTTLKRRPMPLDVIQLDNGWIDVEGDWNANELFPMGMKAIADKITAAGFIPGIWTCPLVLRSESKTFARHPELAARTKGGGYSEYKYVSGHSYAVDPTAPFFKEYITGLYAKLRDWGYQYHKLDFMRSIIVDENIRFHDPKVNRAQAYRIANQTLREAIGDGYLASCGGIHDGGNAGFADSVRTSADTYGFWRVRDREKDARIRIKENVWRAYTNRLWRTDPDASCLRRRETVFRKQRLERHEVLNFGYYNDDEAFTVLVNHYVSGGNVCVCERLAELDEDRRALFRHVIPSLETPARILKPHWPICPNYFLTEVRPKARGLERWWTLAVANWSDAPVMEEIDLGLVGFPDDVEKVAVFEFAQQRFEGLKGRGEKFAVCIPPHATRLYRLAKWDGRRPILLGTDLHLSGGGVEIPEISIHENAIRGRIENKWPYPVRITALFPFEDRQRLMLTHVPLRESAFVIERD